MNYLLSLFSLLSKLLANPQPPRLPPGFSSETPPMTTPTLPREPYDEYESDCLEAFTRLAVEAAAIDPNRGYDSAKARANKVVAIDRVLDQLLVWRAIASELEHADG